MGKEIDIGAASSTMELAQKAGVGDACAPKAPVAPNAPAVAGAAPKAGAAAPTPRAPHPTSQHINNYTSIINAGTTPTIE